MVRTLSIIVSGRVQGVFFRQGTCEKAEELSINGFVRNMPDNTVYILATGHPEKLDQLIEWCRTGPPRARVTDVTVTEVSLLLFPSFTIER
jgi:acylphosphatase